MLGDKQLGTATVQLVKFVAASKSSPSPIPPVPDLLAILGGAIGLIDQNVKLGRLLLELIDPHSQNVTDADHANEAVVLLDGHVADIA